MLMWSDNQALLAQKSSSVVWNNHYNTILQVPF